MTFTPHTLYTNQVLRGLALSRACRAQPVPAILEIPSKEHPYDPNQDSVLQRVKNVLGGDLGAA